VSHNSRHLMRIAYIEASEIFFLFLKHSTVYEIFPVYLSTLSSIYSELPKLSGEDLISNSNIS